MALSEVLAAATGLYVGTGDGPESGPFVSRIDVDRLPNGGAVLGYEACRPTRAPTAVTEMVENEAGSGRFVQREPFGPYEMEIVIDVPEADRITYAWWWGANGDPPVEQSKADARRL